MGKYKLKEGVVLKPYGVNSHVDNSNLTDDSAELYLKTGRADKSDFEPIKKSNK